MISSLQLSSLTSFIVRPINAGSSKSSGLASSSWTLFSSGCSTDSAAGGVSAGEGNCSCSGADCAGERGGCSGDGPLSGDDLGEMSGDAEDERDAASGS